MVKSTLNYLAPMSERPGYYLYEPPPGESWRNTKGDRRSVPIHDARDLEPAPTLDEQGFSLVRHLTAVDDLYDTHAVEDLYYREIQQLVKDQTGAERVLAFDHNVRCERMARRGEKGAQAPVRFVHNDYTEGSGPQRVRDLLDAEEAEARLRSRFAVINVWKPITGPVQATPLAVLDARTLRARDLIATDLRYRYRVGRSTR